MNYILKTIILFTLGFLFIGCISKQLTVKSLHPSLINDKKIYNVILEDFINDNVNQANYLEEKLVNATIDNQRVFNLKPTYKNIDAIVTGEVIESSLFYDIYYDEETDYSRCWKYKYKDGKRTTKCLEYKERKIPCENRDYKLKTKVEVLNQKEELLFTKIYSKTRNKKVCFKNRHYYNPFFHKTLNINRYKYEINSQLAKEIANDIIKDISPHYRYQNITIIEKLEEDNNYDKNTKIRFKNIVELLDNGNINISKKKLHNLNLTLQEKSHEVLYNLALTYEAKNELYKAKEYYLKASKYCKNLENLKLIETAINRTSINLENKIRAKSQINNPK